MARNPRVPMPEGRRWEPGQAPYAEYLRSLTPEQKEQHLARRRERKALKAAVQAVTQHYQAQWVAELHNAAWQQLAKARDTGDTAAFVAVWDRIVGRPQEQTNSDAERPLPWSDADI